MAAPAYPQMRAMPQQRQWNPAMRGRPRRRMDAPQSAGYPQTPIDGPIEPQGPAQLEYSDQPMVPMGDPMMPPPGPAQLEGGIPTAETQPFRVPTPAPYNPQRLTGGYNPGMGAAQPAPMQYELQPGRISSPAPYNPGRLTGGNNPTAGAARPAYQNTAVGAPWQAPVTQPPAQPQQPQSASAQANKGFAGPVGFGSAPGGFTAEGFGGYTPDKPAEQPSQPRTPSWETGKRDQRSASSSNGIKGFAGGGIPQLDPYYGTPTYDPNINNPAQANPFDRRDVFDMYQDIGKQNFTQGQQQQRRFGDLSNYYQDQVGRASGLANGLYSDIWNGGGGYTPEQLSGVKGQEGLDEVKGELGDNQLYDWEKSQISSDPYKAFGLFQGQAPALTDLAAKTSEAGVNAVNTGRDVSGRTLDQMRGDFDGAIDPTKLSLSEGYKPGIDSSLARGRKGVTSAQTDPGLDTTAEYERQAGMTDQEVADMAERAAQDVGARYGSDRDTVLQQALASGQGTPEATAASLAALNRQGAADRGDAITRARLEARAAQRDAAGNVQNTKLNAGQYRAGLRSSNELALQNSDIAANTTAEQMRLAAEQGISGAKLKAAGDVSNAALNTNNTMTALAKDAALQGGQTQLGTGMYNANMATGLVGAAEQAGSDRAKALATNRQGVNQSNQGVKLGVNNLESSRAVTGAAPWLANQQEGRAAATNARDFNAGQANTANQQGLQAWQIGNQGNQAAANGYAGWGSSAGGQGFGDVFGDAFGGAFGQLLGSGGSSAIKAIKPGGFASGGVIDHNHLIEVGEGDRPEAILPLTPATPPNRRNQWERMGAKLGESLGIPQGNAYRENLRHQEMEDDQPDEIEHYDTGGIPSSFSTDPSMWKKMIGAGLGATPARAAAPMALGGKFDWRSMLPPGVSQFLPKQQPAGPQPSAGPADEYSPESWNAGMEDTGEYDPYQIEDGYARGGIPNLKSMLNKSRYRMNMGRHNSGSPLGYGEMGSLGRA